jgi:hypothetical protein
MYQQHGEGYEMQPSQCLRQALIVARQSAQERHPAGPSFYHPVSRQQDEASLGRRQFDDFQADALGLRIGSRLVTSVALILKGHFGRFACRGLDLFRQRLDLSAVLFAVRGDQNRQQLA